MAAVVENFPFRDIPDAFLREAADLVMPFATAFISNDEHRGSGTFARFHGRPGILTANHVWDDVKNRATNVSLLIANRPHRFEIPISALNPLVDLRTAEPQWGPDVQFLQLPASTVGTIEARKTFVNLTDHADDKLALALSESGFLFLAGFPAEFVKVAETVESAAPFKDIEIHGGFTALLGKEYERGSFDYLETTVEKDMKGLPKSFGGVSGAGLWRITLTKRPGAPVATAKIRNSTLIGIAFYQFAAEGVPKTLRYHGPRTIYSVLNTLIKPT
jgi:hypothetical protein